MVSSGSHQTSQRKIYHSRVTFKALNLKDCGGFPIAETGTPGSPRWYWHGHCASPTKSRHGSVALVGDPPQGVVIPSATNKARTYQKLPFIFFRYHFSYHRLSEFTFTLIRFSSPPPWFLPCQRIPCAHHTHVGPRHGQLLAEDLRIQASSEHMIIPFFYSVSL